MPAGGKIGNKGGGRKTFEEEIKDCKEAIKKRTIEELAEDKVYKQITTLKGRDPKDRQGVKEIALPVYLKSKVDKSETIIDFKPIYEGRSIPRHEGDEKNLQPDKEDKSS